MKKMKATMRVNLFTLTWALLYSLNSQAQHVAMFHGTLKDGDIVAARVEEKLYVRDTLSGAMSKLPNGLYTIVRDTLSLFDFVVFDHDVDVEFYGDKPRFRDSLNGQFYRFIHNH